MESKLNTPVEILCKNFPPEFSSYMNYVKSLEFEDKPDYAYLRNLFKDLMLRHEIEYDY